MAGGTFLVAKKAAVAVAADSGDFLVYHKRILRIGFSLLEVVELPVYQTKYNFKTLLDDSWRKPHLK